MASPEPFGSGVVNQWLFGLSLSIKIRHGVANPALTCALWPTAFYYPRPSFRFRKGNIGSIDCIDVRHDELRFTVVSRADGVSVWFHRWESSCRCFGRVFCFSLTHFKLKCKQKDRPFVRPRGINFEPFIFLTMIWRRL